MGGFESWLDTDSVIELERRKYNDICAESRSEAPEAVAQSAAV